MENLKYPTMRYLINTLTVKDFGYVSETDPESGAVTRKLILKKDGLMIPWVSTSVNSIVVENTSVGAYKSVLVQLTPPAPCDTCHYEYSVNVHVKYQQPGVMNDQYYPVSKSYGGVLQAIQTPSGGYMADSDSLLMEDDILTQIKNDQATINVREPAIVAAKRLYILTTAAASTAVYNVTIAGVTTTVTANSGSTVLTQVNDINVDATVGASLVAFAIDATHIAITSINPGVLFTIADGGGATTLSGITRYMWFYALNTDPKFYLDFNGLFGFAKVTHFNVLVLNNTSSAAGNSVMYVKGTASGNIANSATSITYAANITSSSISAYAYASSVKTAGSVAVYVYTGDNELKIKSLGTAGVTVTSQFSGKGIWPKLSWTDVFRVFSNQGGMGRLGNQVYLDQPVKGSLYNKLTLTYDMGVAALDGASHRDNYRQIVEVYIAQGLGGTSLWDASGYRWENNTDAVAGVGGDTGTFTADTTINALLSTWSGLTAGTDFKSII